MAAYDEKSNDCDNDDLDRMTLATHWAAIAAALDLTIQSPIQIPMPDGRIIHASALLKNFGGKNGMVLFEGRPSDLDEAKDALIDMGYGFSCLGPYRDDSKVDLEIAKEILADWTWTGPLGSRPIWLAEPPDSEGF